MMQDTGSSFLVRRILIGDNDASDAVTTTARSVWALIVEMRSRSLEVIEANSYGDGVATLADELIWIVDDTAAFIYGRVQAPVAR
jgi:hypothetical protein